MATNLCPRCNTPNRGNARFCAHCGGALPGSEPPVLPEKPGEKRLQVGAVLQGRYRIESELGRGGFGAVYQTWDTNLSRRCAVKENLNTSPEAQRQFAREATVLANLTHQNLPRVTDHFTLPGQGQYLVMDFVEGDDLASLQRRRGAIPLAQALEWVLQVADALDYLHKRQPPVVHRDIKPANIRITPGGRAMLVDFGLVKIFDPHLKTTIGARAVTPGFAPPEQYGRGITDARTDIYALGATLYALITGKNPMESVQRYSGGRMPLAHEVNPQIPAQIGSAIERAMALEPAQRFQDVAAFRQALLGANVQSPVQPVYAPSPGMNGGGSAQARPAQDDFSGMRGGTVVISSQAGQQPYPAISIPDDAPLVTAPRTANRGLMLGMGALAIVGLCIIAVLAMVIWGYSEVQRQAEVARNQTQTVVQGRTATVDVQRTNTAQSPLTSTARAQATSRAATSAIETAGAEGTRSVISAETATSQVWEALVSPLGITSSRTLQFGPAQGNLTHNAADGLIEDREANVDLLDFVVQTRFYNPGAADTNAWDYGFMLRNAGKNDQLRMVIRSGGNWELRNKVSTEPSTLVQEGSLTNLNTGAGASNFILLIFQGERGFFYLNGDLISELNLSVRMVSGDISVGTGFFEGNETDGDVTRYEDFTVWSIP